jgi:pimeloyl-ACP methyl ester carboxylesterase
MTSTVVLLPGLDGTGEQFGPLVQALGPQVPTVVVRYPDARLDYESHQRIAASFLPQDRPYIILAESFSGPIAVSLAAQSPRSLLGCILCASFVVSPSRLLGLALPFLGFIPPQQVPSALSDFLVMGRFATPARRQMQRAARSSVSPATMVARLKAVARVDVSAQLKAISLPTLYLRATEDRLVPRSSAKHYLRLARAGRVVDLEGPHFLLQARPDLAAVEIRRFMEQLWDNGAAGITRIAG